MTTPPLAPMSAPPPLHRPPVAVLLAAASLVACGGGTAPGEARVRTEVLDLLRSDEWDVLAERDDAPVAIEALRPSTRAENGGLEKLSLLVPPPGEVELRLPRPTDPDADERLFLAPLAGVDWAEEPGAGPVRVAFELLVDGEPAGSAEWTLSDDPARDDELWLPVGPPDGVPLESGARVGLRTRVVEGDPGRGLRAGFSQLVVEREARFEREPAAPDRPNLVLIVLDTLRRDRVSAYGYERPTTPHLDALAERGTLFESATATSSWTWPSTASILTGLLPEEHGVRSRRAWYLDGGHETLPEALLAGGYTTAGWSGNPLIDAGANFDQGFEHFAPEDPRFLRTDAFIDEVEAWIAEQRDWKFFLYLQLVDPHDPYVPRPSDREAFVSETPDDVAERFEHTYSEALFTAARRRAQGATEGFELPPEHLSYMSELYDACVASADHYVGRVLAALETQGLTDRTVVVVTSDHGEEFLDHGFLIHGHTVFGELVDVPLILAGPGVPAGRRVERPVSNRALPATLARLADVEWGGSTDAPDLFDPAPAPLFFSTERGRGPRPQSIVHGVRRGGRELHAFRNGLEADPVTVTLYDLDRDPDQTEDLADRFPEQTADLLELLDGRLAASWRRYRRTELETSAGHLESLRELGYLGDE